MSKALSRIKRDRYQLVATRSGLVFKISRVKTAQMAAIGVVQLIGADSVLEAVEAVKGEQKEQIEAGIDAGRTPEELAQVEANRKRHEAHTARMKQQKAIQAAMSNPAAVQAQTDLLLALFVEGVVAIGVLSDSADVDTAEDVIEGLGDADEAELARALAEAETAAGVWFAAGETTATLASDDLVEDLGPIELTLDGREDHAAKPPVVNAYDIGETERNAVAWRIVAHTKVTERIRPFRREPRVDAGDPSGSPDLREVAT